MKTGEKFKFLLVIRKNNHAKKKNKLQKDDGTISTEPKEMLNMQVLSIVIYIYVNQKNQKIK